MNIWNSLDKIVNGSLDLLGAVVNQGAKKIDKMKDEEIEKNFSYSVEEMRNFADTMHTYHGIRQEKKEVKECYSKLNNDELKRELKNLEKKSIYGENVDIRKEIAIMLLNERGVYELDD